MLRRLMMLGAILAVTGLVAVASGQVTQARAQEGAPPAQFGEPQGAGGAPPDEPMMQPGPGMGPGSGRHMRGRGIGPLRGRGGPPAAVLEQLGLSQAQREKVASLHDEQARKVIRIEADLKIAQLDLHKLVASDKPDLRAIEAQIDKVAGLRAGIAKARVATRIAVRAMLTDEQREKLRRLGPPGMGPGGPGGHRGPRGRLGPHGPLGADADPGIDE